MEHYERLEARDVMEKLATGRAGLSAEEAATRRHAHGPNGLAEEKQQGVLAVFLSQFKDLMVVILMITAVISFVTGSRESTIVILAVLVMNAVLGTVQHFKAEKSLQSLQAMSAPTAKVMRDGVTREVPAREIARRGIFCCWRRGTWSPPTGGSSIISPCRSMRAPSPARPRASTRPMRRWWGKSPAGRPEKYGVLRVACDLRAGKRHRYGDGDGDGAWQDRGADDADQAAQDAAAGGHGPVQPEACHRHFHRLRRRLCPEPGAEDAAAGFPHVRRRAGGGSDPGGAELYRYHRPGHGDAEDGAGARDYQRIRGRREPGGASTSSVPTRPGR